jgi:hypothetical protein
VSPTIGEHGSPQNEYLADWEQQHFEALKKLYDSVREDFFASGNFAPF